MQIKIQPYHTSLNTKKFALKTLLSATLLGDAILPYRTDRTEAIFFQNKDRTQALRAESIECKNLGSSDLQDSRNLYQYACQFQML